MASFGMKPDPLTPISVSGVPLLTSRVRNALGLGVGEGEGGGGGGVVGGGGGVVGVA